MSMGKSPDWGEIWFADFGPFSQNHAYCGNRPCVVLQSSCQISETILVAPISSRERKKSRYTQNVDVYKPSVVHYESIVPLSREQFIRFVRNLDSKEMFIMGRKLIYEFGLTRFMLNSINRVRLCSMHEMNGTAIVTGKIEYSHYEKAFHFYKCKAEEIAKKKFINLEELEIWVNSIDGLKYVMAL